MAEEKRTIDDLFEDLDGADTTATSTTAKPTPTSSTGAGDQDALDDLESWMKPRTSTSSRPQTPKLNNPPPSTTSTQTNKAGTSAILTPSSGRSSEEKTQDVITTEKAAPPPSATSSSQEAAQAAGGSWWGGLSAIASAAVKQAEAAVKEIQRNEDAQKMGRASSRELRRVERFGYVNLPWPLLKLTRSRRRTQISSIANLCEHYSYPCSAYLSA